MYVRAWRDMPPFVRQRGEYDKSLSVTAADRGGRSAGKCISQTYNCNKTYTSLFKPGHKKVNANNICIRITVWQIHCSQSDMLFYLQKEYEKLLNFWDFILIESRDSRNKGVEGVWMFEITPQRYVWWQEREFTRYERTNLRFVIISHSGSGYSPELTLAYKVQTRQRKIIYLLAGDLTRDDNVGRAPSATGARLCFHTQTRRQITARCQPTIRKNFTFVILSQPPFISEYYPANGKSLTKCVKSFSAEIKGRCDHISNVTPTIFQADCYLTRLISVAVSRWTLVLQVVAFQRVCS